MYGVTAWRREGTHLGGVQSRMRRMRWILPVALSLASIAYQLGPATWVHDLYSHPLHYLVELAFYGLFGPLAVYWALGWVNARIEERDRLELQARTTERRLAAVSAASADAIVGLDTQGRIESWNRGAELIFGYPQEEIVGRPLSDLLPPGAPAQAEVRWLESAVGREGFVRGLEATLLDRSGREVAAELTAARLLDEGGRSLGMSLVLRDIGERRQREQEIRRLNARLNDLVQERTAELARKVDELARANGELEHLDRQRSEFVSVVTHQLRAPLTNILGALGRIEADCPAPSATCQRMLVILDRQIDRLDRLVRDVLNAARIESGEIGLHAEPISVLPVVAQVVEQARARSGDRPFELPAKPGLPLAFADRDRVAEVLANLLDNADKYSPPLAAVAVDVGANETEIVIQVRDRGPGLAGADPERIFDKFYRADGSDSQSAYGYGLGLYVCRQLVEAMGGRIWAETERQGGALFSFTLPRAVDP